MFNIDRNALFRKAAGEFAEKAKGLSSILEVALFGSVAGNDPYPYDLDIVVIIRDIEDIDSIAKFSRQISKYNHAWEVFVLDRKLTYLGRICHRRECPVKSVDCFVPDCGEIPNINVDPKFEYNESELLSSPIEVLYSSSGISLLLARRKEMGITKIKEYKVIEDIEIKCMDCGDRFTLSGGEQKYFKKEGKRFPRRCEKCVEEYHNRKYREDNDDWDSEE